MMTSEERLQQHLDEVLGELAEVHAELNKLGAPPAQRAQTRLRGSKWVALDEVIRRVQETRAEVDKALVQPYRRRLPDERNSINHKFSVGGHDGYLTVGLFEDGSPGELFFRIAKEGSTVYGLLDCFAIAVSTALQWGAPLRSLCDKFEGQAFEPRGWTGNSEIAEAQSIVDYVFRFLRLKFLGRTEEQQQAEDAKIARAAAVAAIDASMQFAPKACVEAMTAARKLLDG